MRRSEPTWASVRRLCPFSSFVTFTACQDQCSLLCDPQNLVRKRQKSSSNQPKMCRSNPRLVPSGQRKSSRRQLVSELLLWTNLSKIRRSWNEYDSFLRSPRHQCSLTPVLQANETIDDIGDELKLARKQLIAFARRMATDKLIRFVPHPIHPTSASVPN